MVCKLGRKFSHQVGLVTQLHLTLCDTMDCSPPGSFLCPWNSPGKNTGVHSHSIVQGNLPTQGSNLGLLHCMQILYHLSHQGSPNHQRSSVKSQCWSLISVKILVEGRQESTPFQTLQVIPPCRQDWTTVGSKRSHFFPKGSCFHCKRPPPRRLCK